MIKRESIELFKIACEEMLKETRKKQEWAGGAGKRTSTLVSFVSLNKRLQQKLGIQDQIRKLVFDNADGSKFYFDEHTKSQKLNPKYLAGIKEYAVIKDLVCQSADKNRMVDTNLLNGLID